MQKKKILILTFLLILITAISVNCVSSADLNKDEINQIDDYLKEKTFKITNVKDRVLDFLKKLECCLSVFFFVDR